MTDELQPTMRFTTSELPTGPVRTYALFGIPDGPGPHPAILHIHGGGQTASPEAVAEQVARGYACLSFDWTGGPREDRADEVIAQYPPDDVRHVPVARAERAYLGCEAALRCLERVAGDPRIDAERIGIYGISWGGFMAWKVAAVSPYVTCAVPIYGTGGLMRPGHLWDRDWATLSEAEQEAWLEHMEPMTFAPRITCPVLHLNGTDDFFGSPDVFRELAHAVPDGARVDYSPNANHHVSRGGVRLMERFFDRHLRGGPPLPPPPRLDVGSIDGSRITVGLHGTGGRLRLWYSPGHPRHGARCWRGVDGPDGAARAQTVTVSSSGETWLMLKETFPDGTSQCSLPAAVRVEPDCAPHTDVLFDGRSLDGLGTRMQTEIRMGGDVDEVYARSAEGLCSGPETSGLLNLCLRTPALRECRAPVGAALELGLRGVARLEVHAVRRQNRPDAADFVCIVEAPGDGALVLPCGRFVAADGAACRDFATIECFWITVTARAGESACLRHCTWTPDVDPRPPAGS